MHFIMAYCVKSLLFCNKHDIQGQTLNLLLGIWDGINKDLLWAKHLYNHALISHICAVMTHLSLIPSGFVFT